MDMRKFVDALTAFEREELLEVLKGLNNAPTAPTEQELDALRRGKTIEAIKLLRNRCNLGLRDAADIVRRWEQDVRK